MEKHTKRGRLFAERQSRLGPNSKSASQNPPLPMSHGELGRDAD
jgi:hypothetical protein